MREIIHSYFKAFRSNGTAKPVNNHITIKKEYGFCMKTEPGLNQMYECEKVAVGSSANVVCVKNLQQELKSVKTENTKINMKLESAQKKHQCELLEWKTKYKILLRENKSMSARMDQLMRGLNCNELQKTNKENKHQQNILGNRNVYAKCDAKINASTNEVEVEYEVEQILSHKNRYNKPFFLVRWKGFDSNSDSWVREENLSCPKLLEEYLSRT